MNYFFKEEKPIYLQIIEYIKMQIITNRYMPNEKIPPVRELAIEFNVNPNTVQKALMELENEKLIKTERTNGKFVTNDKKLILKIKKETIKIKIDEFFVEMNNLGFDKEQIIELLNKGE